MYTASEIIPFFKNKKVLITGNTGFIGTWLSLFLAYCGAEVTGYTKGSKKQSELSKAVHAHIGGKQYQGDIRSKPLLEQAIIDSKPDIIFHLAGQAFIQEAFRDPFETINTNVFGTLALLDVLRDYQSTCALVVLTGDRCYKVKEGKQVYLENDEVGGSDPYSISKAMQEQLIAMYHRSFFSGSESLIRCSTIRSGNLVGGADFSDTRLFHGIARAIWNDESVLIHHPNARKSWLHIFDAVVGYLLTAKGLIEKENISGESFNLSPDGGSMFTTLDVVQMFLKAYPASNTINSDEGNDCAPVGIALSNEKIKSLLGWECSISFEQAIRSTTEWYKVFNEKKENIIQYSMEEIDKYFQRAVK